MCPSLQKVEICRPDIWCLLFQSLGSSCSRLSLVYKWFLYKHLIGEIQIKYGVIIRIKVKGAINRL